MSSISLSQMASTDDNESIESSYGERNRSRHRVQTINILGKQGQGSCLCTFLSAMMDLENPIAMAVRPFPPSSRTCIPANFELERIP
jgi:hypothetical protein